MAPWAGTRPLAGSERSGRSPLIVALELGHRLIQTASGVETLQQFMLDDIISAQRQRRCGDCEEFSRTLADYNEKHPERREAPPDQVERLHELLAIGQRDESRQAFRGSNKRRKIALRDVQKAKDRHDCCACGRLSLRLLCLLETVGDAAVESKT